MSQVRERRANPMKRRITFVVLVATLRKAAFTVSEDLKL
jgi:hypothetical protein